MTHSTDALRRSIGEAFAGTAPPAQPVPQAAPGHSGHDERKLLAAALHGKAWTQVSASLAQEHHDTLPFFSEEGFRHYLPAWLTGALTEGNDLDSSALQALRPPKGAEPAAFEHPNRGCSKAQRAALAAFLAHLARTPDDFDAAALAEARGYWG